MATTPGFVYLVQSGDDYRFKVGRTANLLRRMRTLQLGSPVPLHLIAWHRTPDSVEHEKQWHKNLGISRQHGEWFDLTLQQLRLFQEFASVFSRVDRPICPLESPGPYYHSIDLGKIIEVRIVEIERSDEPWPLLTVESTTTEGDQTLLYMPYGKEQTFPGTTFNVYGDEVFLDPRGALLCPPWSMTKHFSREDWNLHVNCEREMGHRLGFLP